MGENSRLIIGDSVKIVIIGAGAIGSLFGGFLAKKGNDVSLIGRKPHVDKINEEELIIEATETFAQARHSCEL